MTSLFLGVRPKEYDKQIGLHTSEEVSEGLSSPISTRGKLKMFLKSSRATLICFLNLLVVICSALDLQDDGK